MNRKGGASWGLKTLGEWIIALIVGALVLLLLLTHFAPKFLEETLGMGDFLDQFGVKLKPRVTQAGSIIIPANTRQVYDTLKNIYTQYPDERDCFFKMDTVSTIEEGYEIRISGSPSKSVMEVIKGVNVINTRTGRHELEGTAPCVINPEKLQNPQQSHSANLVPTLRIKGESLIGIANKDGGFDQGKLQNQKISQPWLYRDKSGNLCFASFRYNKFYEGRLNIIPESVKYNDVYNENLFGQAAEDADFEEGGQFHRRLCSEDEKTPEPKPELSAEVRAQLNAIRTAIKNNDREAEKLAIYDLLHTKTSLDEYITINGNDAFTQAFFRTFIPTTSSGSRQQYLDEVRAWAGQTHAEFQYSYQQLGYTQQTSFENLCVGVVQGRAQLDNCYIPKYWQEEKDES